MAEPRGQCREISEDEVEDDRQQQDTHRMVPPDAEQRGDEADGSRHRQDERAQRTAEDECQEDDERDDADGHQCVVDPVEDG